MSGAVGLLAEITLDQFGSCGLSSPPSTLTSSSKSGTDCTQQKASRGIMNFSKADLLRLLGLLEAELQARELVIASLKAERTKLLRPATSKQRYTIAHPYTALGRDLDGNGNSNNSSSGGGVSSSGGGGSGGSGEDGKEEDSSNALSYLETMVAKHKKAEAEMRLQLQSLKDSHAKMVTELDEEKRKHASDTAQGDDVTYMLEKERERLAQQLDFEKAQQKKLEKETKRTQAALVQERKKHLQFAKVILDERKVLLMDLGEMKQRMEELEDMMIVKEAQLASAKACLHKERKRFTKMEAGIEKRLSEFDIEREQLRAKLNREENRTRELREELDAANNCINDLQLSLAEARHIDASNGNHENPTSATNGREVNKPLGRVTGSPNTAAKTGKIGTPRGMKTPPRYDKSESSSSGSEELCSPMSPVVSVAKPITGKPQKTGYQPHYGTPAKPASGNQPDTKSTESDTGRTEVKTSAKQKGSLMYSKGNGKTLSPASSLDRLNRANTSSPPPQRGSKIPSSTSSPARSSLVSPQQNRKGSGEFERPSIKQLTAPSPKPTATNLVRPTALSSSPFLKAVDAFKSGPKKVSAPGLPGSHQSSIAFHPMSKVGSPSVPKAAVSPLVNMSKKPPPQTSKPPTPTQPTGPVSKMNPPSPSGSTGSTTPTSTGSVVQPAKQGVQPPSFAPPAKRTVSPRGSAPVIARLPPSTAAPVSPLHRAAVAGDTATICRLIEENHSPSCREVDGSTPVHAAAEHGQVDCLELLLDLGGDITVDRTDGVTPLHSAAGQGHIGCLNLLLDRNCNPCTPDSLGWYPLHWASANGHADCVRILIDCGSPRDCVTKGGWTPLHCAAKYNHPDCLQTLLYHMDPTAATNARPDINLSCDRVVSCDLLNAADQEGWTVAHVAASTGQKECLEMLCNYGDLNLDARDRRRRTPLDVATDSCKEFLSTLEAKSVRVSVDLRGTTSSLSNQKQEHQVFVVGQLTVQPGMTWATFDLCMAAVLHNHSKDLEGWSRLKTDQDVESEEGSETCTDLGLNINSIKSYVAGNLQWSVGESPQGTRPHELFTLTSEITVRLCGIDAGRLDQLAYETLIPMAALQNYVRLIEQYKSVVFYGPPGTGKTMLASQLAEFVKSKLQPLNIKCTISHVALHSNLSQQELTKQFYSKGILQPSSDVPAPKEVPILLLDGLDKSSLPGALSDLLKGLERRGSQQLSPSHGSGQYLLHPDCIVIGTMDKSSSGLDLATQHCFRWVQLHHDREPVASTLPRYLLRRVISHAHGRLPPAEDPAYRAMEWICLVWQRLNDCFIRLKLKHTVLGPKHFRACPVDSEGMNSVFRWFCLSWNHAIAPQIEDTLRRKNSNSTHSHNYQRLVSTTLYVLLQRAVFPGCPFTGEEADDYMSSFRGVNELLAQLSTQRTNSLKRSPRRSKSLDRSKTSNKAALLASKQQSALDLDSSHSDVQRNTRSMIPRRVPKSQAKTVTSDNNSNPISSIQPEQSLSSPVEDTDLLASLLQLQGCPLDSDMDQLTQLQENLLGKKPVGTGSGSNAGPEAATKRAAVSGKSEKQMKRPSPEGAASSPSTPGDREKSRKRSKDDDGVWDVWEETV